MEVIDWHDLLGGGTLKEYKWKVIGKIFFDKVKGIHLQIFLHGEILLLQLKENGLHLPEKEGCPLLEK